METTITALIATLETLPSLILLRQARVATLTATVDELRHRLAVREAELLIGAATAELFDDGKGGKRTAKNEEERKAAAVLANDQSRSWKIVTRHLAQVVSERDCEAALMQALTGQQSNARAIAQLLAAQMNAA